MAEWRKASRRLMGLLTSTRRRVLGALVAGALLGGGLAGTLVWAAASPPTHTIYACKLSATGLVRIVSGPRSCLPTVEKPMHWNAVGPQGPRGPRSSPLVPGSALSEFASTSGNMSASQIPLDGAYHVDEATVQSFTVPSGITEQLVVATPDDFVFLRHTNSSFNGTSELNECSGGSLTIEVTLDSNVIHDASGEACGNGSASLPPLTVDNALVSGTHTVEIQVEARAPDASCQDSATSPATPVPCDWQASLTLPVYRLTVSKG